MGGGGEDAAMSGSAATEARAALSDKCRLTCESGYGSELTRRGGGDHEQRLKRVWGSTNRPQAAQAARPLPRRMKRVYKGERKGGMRVLPKASYRLGSDRSPHFKLAHKKLLR